MARDISAGDGGFWRNHGADTSEFLPQLSIKTVLQLRSGALKPIASMLYCFASQRRVGYEILAR